MRWRIGLGMVGLGMVGLGALGLAVAAPAALAATESGPRADSMVSYLNNGYRIVAKSEETRVMPGQGAYANLPRHLQVITYRLARNGEAAVCVMTYDSQAEGIHTDCQPE